MHSRFYMLTVRGLTVWPLDLIKRQSCVKLWVSLTKLERVQFLEKFVLVAAAAVAVS